MPVRIRQYCRTDYSASGSSDLYLAAVCFMAGLGIEKGLTDARSHPSVLQDGLFRVRLFRLVFSGSFFDQLLQFL